MDLADRITALQRKKAAAETAPRTRGVVAVPAAAAPTAHTDAHLRRPAQETSPRRSSALSPPQSQRTRQLFNPDSDPIPMMRATRQEPVPQPPQPQRQLFDPRRDDPMRFAVLNNTAHRDRQPPSSIQSSSVPDHSSISSYASSTWTLTSSTGTSQSSAPPDQSANRDKDKEGTSKFVTILKKVYREITDLENKIKEWDHAADDDAMAAVTITMLKPGEPMPAGEEGEKPDPLRALVTQHRQLAELYHSMITMILQPVPASMLSFVEKYKLPSRLWSNGVLHCIESLRRLSIKYPGAVEHMTGYVYWSYHLYEALYETSTLNEFMAPYRVNWIEALGDLARYHMHVASRQGAQNVPGPAPAPLTEEVLPQPMPRIDDTPPPSIGLAAAQSFDLEPEVDVWRKNSQLWYALVLKETPGNGKLQHNLGMLIAEVNSEELRGTYHFVKSMTANHPYPASRETILPLFSRPSQLRRNLADARTPELFVLLHGMLFTNIQLDDFQPTLARYLERLELDGAQEREWIMMAAINVAAILQYGKADSVIKISSGTSDAGANVLAGKKRELVLKMDSLAVSDSTSTPSNTMDVDTPTPTLEDPMSFDVPFSLQLTLQLAFSTLSFCLRNPFRRSSQFARPTLNPYITITITFLHTVIKIPGVLQVIERSFPWDDLVTFLQNAPRKIFNKELEARAKLTSGCAPLPEDWCIRGMSWAARRVYEHGFWGRGGSSANSISGEMDVLLANENVEQDTDGIIEDDEQGEDVGPKDYTNRRWVRIIRGCLSLAHSVPGFELRRQEGGSVVWELGDAMRLKAEAWKEEDRRERAEEERRRNRHWDEDEDDMQMEVDDEEEEEEFDDDPDVRALQERRQYLRSLQSNPRRRSMHGRPRKLAPSRPLVSVRPGYSVLVVDTNILLSALPSVSALVESNKWTVLIPLAVITELDGISNNQNELGNAASAALQYVTTHIRSHSTSLKVQTSRGNYLTTLNVRSENFDFVPHHREGGGHVRDRNLDDLILRAALWQEDHWVDRTALLRGVSSESMAPPASDDARVVLLTFDRNLRLKARSRHMHAGDERDIAHILKVGST